MTEFKSALTLHIEDNKLQRTEIIGEGGALGCSANALYQWETGRKRPNAKWTTRIYNWSKGKVTANDHQRAYEAFHGKV